MKILKWVIWNTFIMGILILGYFLNQTDLASKAVNIIISISIGIIILGILLAAASASEDVRKKLSKNSA